MPLREEWTFRTGGGRRLSHTSSLEEPYPESFNVSPMKLSYYKRFSSDDVDIELSTTSSRPSLATILLFIVLSAVFFILPIIYLLNCFDIIYEHKSLKHNPIVIDKVAKELDDESVLPNPPGPQYSQCNLLKDVDRLDCFPESTANKAGCELRGCCWVPTKLQQNNPLDVPYCYYPPNYISYKLLNITQLAYGLEAYLARVYRSAYPNDLETIKLIAKFETNERLNVKIVDPAETRFQSPFPTVPMVDVAATDQKYIFELDKDFRIIRKSDNITIFEADFTSFIYAEQLIQITGKLPTNNIYGIGDHTTKLKLNTEWTSFTLWNHDLPPMINKNLYGSHPFYLAREPSGNYHGVFLLNSNAMDVLLQPSPAITFRTIGGIANFYFFLGPSPADVIRQYHNLIGLPALPPYWSLGYHLCRFGYKTLNNTITVLNNNLNAGILIDTQWNDLDYMNNSNDFTYDKVNYQGLPEFVNELHQRGMHYVPLIDPGVSAGEKPNSYPPYDVGIQMDIFIKNSTNLPFVGKVWNSRATVWPDFTNPSSVDYWIKMLKLLHDEIKFDGVWIDMNEPSNFLSGSFDGCPAESPLNSPPYLPNIDGGSLYYKTVCMTAKHHLGMHYDIHNLYGMAEAIVTSFALAELRDKRPLIISRATFAGQGQFSGHWSGDVFSTWEAMKQSIPHLLSFSLYGIPLMGADICGFNGNTTASLCNRWQQLGAFYPFSRNHNTDDGIPQDPYSMGPQVVNSTINAYKIRYSMLPYLYTLFYKAHAVGDTVARPLFFEFPQDNATIDLDTVFMWGAAVLIVPVLVEGATEVVAYLPDGIWYDYQNQYRAIVSDGSEFNVSAPLDTIPVFIRGGSVLPMQQPNSTAINSRLGKLELLVAPAKDGTAYGDLYWDDGDSLNTVEEKRYSFIQFRLDNATLTSTVLNWAGELPPNLDKVTVVGVTSVVNVTVNHKPSSFKFDKYLTINLDLCLNATLTISWE